MKLRYLVSLAMLASIVGCSTSAPSLQTGNDAEATYDDLVREGLDLLLTDGISD